MKTHFILRPFLASLILLVFASAYAALWDNVDIPVPADAKLGNSQSLQMADVERKISVYKTGLSPEEVLSFYKTQMPNRGWAEDTTFAQEVKKSDYLSAVQGQEMPGLPTPEEMYEHMLSFSKGDYNMYLVVVPRHPLSKFTVFSINTGKKMGLMGTGGKPAKKLDFMPTYPDAEQIFASARTYMYNTADDIGQVVSFYKKNMPGYGWQLAREEPIMEKAFDPAHLFKQELNCPTCPQGISGKIGDAIPEDIKAIVAERLNKIKTLASTLKYTKGSAKSITLEFKQMQGGEPGSSQRGTTISVGIDE